MARILVIDDDPASVMLIEHILKQCNHDVITARTAVRGVELSVDRPIPDLILIDKQMPEISGIQGVKMLREIGYKGKIVALTGTSSPNDRAMFMSAGCDSFITKPIDQEFVDRLDKILMF